MNRSFIPKTQSDRQTWDLIKKHRPAYAQLLIEFTQAFGKPKDPVYYGEGWKVIGGICETD